MFPFCENIIITQALLNGQTPKSIVKMSLGEREPWSSGYGSRLMFERSCVLILVPYTGWT